ncbi:MAG: zinc ribbon domain-containing protein, partial [Chloroflexota bacterium]|nr:zinc ribbon domain-containing protein [Chloroflexota bacterium]
MMTEKITCPECGAENLEDAEFCIVCHANLREDSTSAFIDPQQPDQDDFDLLMGEEDDLPGLLNALKQADGD